MLKIRTRELVDCWKAYSTFSCLRSGRSGSVLARDAESMVRGMTSALSCVKFYLAILTTCGLALRLSRMGLFLLTSASYCGQFLVSDIVHSNLCARKLIQVTSVAGHQAVSIIFFVWKSDFGLICEVQLRQAIAQMLPCCCTKPAVRPTQEVASRKGYFFCFSNQSNFPSFPTAFTRIETVLFEAPVSSSNYSQVFPWSASTNSLGRSSVASEDCSQNGDFETSISGISEFRKPVSLLPFFRPSLSKTTCIFQAVFTFWLKKFWNNKALRLESQTFPYLLRRPEYSE